MKEIVTKLYFDTGLGFNEEQAITQTIDSKCNKVEFLFNPLSVNMLRFVPISDDSVLQINSIAIVREDNSSYNLGNYQTNALYQKNNDFIFTVKNPQIDLNIFNQRIKKVIINLIYIAIGEQYFNYLPKFIEGLLREQDFQIHEQDMLLRKQIINNKANEARINQLSMQIDILKRNVNLEPFAIVSNYYRILKNNFKTILKQFDPQYKLIKKSDLFDKKYYLEENLDVKINYINPLTHYIYSGACEGRNPNPLFDSEYYLKQNPKIVESDINSLAHYIQFGFKEGRNPHPLFDSEYYLKQNPEIVESDINPLAHYIQFGFKEGRSPHPLFDSEYYLKQNPEIVESDINSLAHYIQFGFKEGRSPHPLFDSEYYLKQNPEIVESDINPLAHYIQFGFKEGRGPHPLFDSEYYLKQNPQAAQSNINPLVHYIRFGASEGKEPSAIFDTMYYLEQNPDVAKSKINPLAHYVHYGVKEGKSPSRLMEKHYRKPKISIITPVYNVDEIYLQNCILSVLKQSYNKWELCLVDDGSTKPHIKTILEKYAKKDQRVKVKFLKENQGISSASNAGLFLAAGEFICFLDHDDELTKDALYEVVNVIIRNNADIIYSDERLISNDGKHIGFIYKPDFSPDLLFSHNYITHLLVVRKSMLLNVEGFSSKYDGAQDYDLILRLTEKTKKICHIPKALYNWRNIATSTSLNPEIKSYADDAGKMALEAALERREIAGDVSKTNTRFYYRVKRKLNYQPLISIIIPFKDEPNLLESCIETILSKTSYKNYEIIGISNNSEMEKTYRIINEFQQTDERFKFYEYNIPFNFSKINNYAVGLAKGEHIVLMNNDIKIINSDWIEALLEHSQRKEVGAVGAKLYYHKNTIQHAGIIIGISGCAGHSHKHFKRDAPGYYNRLMCILNVSAVTGALFMVKKKIYMEAGGLDEKNLSIALNDVDFCLGLREMGLLNIFTPYCEAYHYESVSRGYEVTPEKNTRFNKEAKYFQNKWKDLLVNGDPYYNPNLTLEREDFSLKNM